MKIKTKSYFSQALMALLSLLFLITSVNLLQNFGRGTTDLSENSIAQAPTNTTYWIDETTQTALGVDFDNYTLTQDTSASTTTYLIQSEKDLAFLSWTIYNNKAYNNHKSSRYFYSGITFKQTKDLDLSVYYWQPIGIRYTRDGASASRYFSGKYDGGGYTVSGVYTPAGEGYGYNYQGLFGYVQGQSSTNKATIQNIGVIDSFIQGEYNIGGVVGYALSSTITNCYNTGSVSGRSSVGGVVGYTYSYSTITNCYNTGTIEGTGDYVGGVVGYALSSTITNCYNTGSVSGRSSVGGVVGYAGADLTNCYNTGTVEGTGEYVGGVVGWASNSTIANCYNTGSVSGENSVGGVVGRAGDDVTNCYNTGTVEGTDNVGGVVGYISSSSTTVSNVYNTGSVSGSSNVGGVVGQPYSSATISNTYYGGDCEAIGGIKGEDVDGQAEYLDNLEVLAKNEEWYLNSSNWNRSYPWNFETVWAFVSGAPNYVVNNGYPVLQSFGMTKHEIIYWTDEYVQTKLGVDFDNYTLTQDTSASATTYLIQSETDLAFLSWTIYTGNAYNNHVSGSYYYSDVYFKQTKNLDLSAYYWQPIGIYFTRDGTSARRYFSGNYDGGGHTVSGVFTPAGTGSGYSYQGLFGYVNGSSAQLATIQNIGVIGSFVQGSFRVGGVVGEASVYSTITNCYNTGSVNGANEVVGGVVGRADATVSNVYNTGSVSGSSNVGGVVGYASSSSATVSNAYNTGIVSGSGNYVGGVVGNANSLTVSNVYNTGTVEGTGGRVGGVVGYAYSATITNVYNTGLVSGNSQVGGVVGRASGSATISDCGVECAVITGTSNVGIFVGYIPTGATVENCYAVVEGGIAPYGTNSGTFTNCLWIEGDAKNYYGTDFSGFAWLNPSGCPIPKDLALAGQFWTEDITNQIISSGDWSAFIA